MRLGRVSAPIFIGSNNVAVTGKPFSCSSVRCHRELGTKDQECNAGSGEKIFGLSDLGLVCCLSKGTDPPYRSG